MKDEREDGRGDERRGTLGAHDNSTGGAELSY